MLGSCIACVTCLAVQLMAFDVSMILSGCVLTAKIDVQEQTQDVMIN